MSDQPQTDALKLRNVAIIAHVDHGKTTLIDQLLMQSGSIQGQQSAERMMDNDDLEKERGITILAKNCAISWKQHQINLVDTPGHADFGGEVERILSMVDSVLLLVDAVEGPMPQTRFVTQKAFAHNLNPIVVINKIDRPNARADWVLDQTFELFDLLGASDQQLDFPVLYTSAIQGYATADPDNVTDNMDLLFQTIIDSVPPPPVEPDQPFQMQISQLDYSSYLGVIGIGRVKRGRAARGASVISIDRNGAQRKGKLNQIFGFKGLGRVEVPVAEAGNILAVAGIDELHISDTITAPEHPEGLPPLQIDEPTISVTFQANTSPLSGLSGTYVTARQLGDRLQKESLHNVALSVRRYSSGEQFEVSGRGELHLSVLIEKMRREGYEMAVSSPQIIDKEQDGQLCEPYETVTLDIEAQHQGSVIQRMQERGGVLQKLQPDLKGREQLEFLVSTRGMMGFQNELMALTSGSALMHRLFAHYAPKTNQSYGQRKNGVLISNGSGKALGFALYNLQSRGQMLIGPNEAVYEGQVVGIHTRNNDLVVNPLKGKQLTNIRASGKDDAIQLTPPLKYSLEEALNFIDVDELVEVTPADIRIRKQYLLENDRKRHSRPSKDSR
ncbi:MAG: translational GTPase TypA [Gammaproteobacteria bacterium]